MLRKVTVWPRESNQLLQLITKKSRKILQLNVSHVSYNINNCYIIIITYCSEAD